MNISVIGHVCIDENISENTSYTAPGSPAVFIDRIFKQFPDSHVGIVASYGSDLVQYLDGVDIYPSNPNAAKTLLHKNVTKLGKRFSKSFNIEESAPPELTDKAIEIIRRADILFFAPLWPNIHSDYIRQVSEISDKDSLKILLPQGYFRTVDTENNQITREFVEASEILPFVDIVIVSEQDHPDMMRVVGEWVHKFDLITVVTLGEKGAIAISKHGETVLPANPVLENEVVDSVGSGDIFSAGFAYRYKQTKNIKEAGKFANSLARQALFYPASKIKIDINLLK